MTEKRQEKTPQQQNPYQPGRAWNIIFIIVLGWLTISIIGKMFMDTERPTIPYNEFKQKINQGEITEITFQGSNITGSMTPAGKQEQPEQTARKNGETVEQRPFSTILPPYEDPALPQLFAKHNVTVHVKPAGRSWLLELLIAFLPWILIIGFFVYTSRKMSERMGGAQGVCSASASPGPSSTASPNPGCGWRM